MSVTVQDVIKIAQGWVGRNERDGSHKSIIDVYNTQTKLPRGYKVKYSDSWCATFVTAVFIKAGGLYAIYPECSCEKMIEGLKSKGWYIEDENRVPNVGDIVFYDWNDNGIGDCKGHADHTGIVESVTGKTFIVIEGNYQDSVKRRVLTVNQKYLRGFGVPNYTTGVVNTKKSVEEIAREVIAGKWGNGSTRKKNLVDAGYDYALVQNAVNKILKKGV